MARSRGRRPLREDGDHPPHTLSERLSREFHAWEVRGRGWRVFDAPVELEPLFVPFSRGLADFSETPDDGQRPSRSIAAGKAIWRLLKRSVFRSEDPETERTVEDLAIPSLDSGPAAEIDLVVPPDLLVTPEAAERLLVSLPPASGPFGFEVLGIPDRVAVQLVSREEDCRLLLSQVRSHFPGVVATRSGVGLADGWTGGGEVVVVDFGLSEEFMRPVLRFRRFEPDPLTGVVAALSAVEDSEAALLQVLWKRVQQPWAEHALIAVQDGRGGSFFADAPEMPRLARDKLMRPLFAAIVRVAAKAGDPVRALELARAVGGALGVLEDPAGNALLPLANSDYPDPLHELDLLDRVSHRTGMLLSSAELAGLVHLPNASLKAERLVRRARKTRSAPGIVAGGELVLGANLHEGRETAVTLSADQRSRHLYLVGASGTGKSTLLLNLIMQDIEAGRGVGVLDPHGDLIDQILGRVPETRLEDVILFDPSDAEFPIGFNVLSAHSELERTLLSSDLVASFRRLSTSWGDQMNAVLANAILAFLESAQGGTLIDLRRFLVEALFRKEFLTTVQDPDIVYYWEKEYPLLSGKPQAPILTRLDAFLRPKPIRYMVAQKENRLDFSGMMNDGRIFLGKLSQGAIGEENAYLMGAFLVAKLQQTALSRQELREEERRPFYLYIDEFHNFITPSVASILAGARKYRMGLTLAHQDLRQLSARDPEVLNSVLTNPYSRICFRVGDHDAKALSEGLAHFDRTDLQNLGTGQAIVRVERAEYDFTLDTSMLPDVAGDEASERREKVIRVSRERYACPREDVEHLLGQEREEKVVETSGKGRVEATPAVMESKPAMAREAEKKAPSSPVERPKVSAATPGRGGRQHKYLQELVKRWGEANGWRATIEEGILDGLGRVDVALRKGGRSVACEVSVTTDAEHEIGNAQKCLAAGFDRVVLIVTGKNKLQRLTKALDTTLSEEERLRASVVSPDELFTLLGAMDAEGVGEEETIKGYRVKVRYRPVKREEIEARRQVVSQVIAKALGRMKEKDGA